MAAPNDLILYHYSFSPYARRVTWYLALRNIEYAQCLQPPTLPRPDLTSLGLRYRRIPVLAHGRSLYCDSRLILATLDAAFPASAEHPSLVPESTPLTQVLEVLLPKWTMEAGLFARGAQLIPPEMPLLSDPRFVADREAYSGRSWARETIRAKRPEALVAVREAFDIVERVLLGDGRHWIAGGDGPTILDIEAVWPFHWLHSMPGALPPALISAANYPRTFAWIARFTDAVSTARRRAHKPLSLPGPEARALIMSASFAGGEIMVDEGDPLGLTLGQEVEVGPTDTGVSHRDRGRLVGLGKEAVVIEAGKEEGLLVRMHYPRTGFRITAVSNDAKL